MVNKSVIAAVSAGAALAYIADPVSGRRRRALVRDRVVHASRKTRDALDATVRDVTNRSKGMRAKTANRGADPHPVEDVVLIERVRAKLGRVCSHPRAIDVHAERGVVTLSGPILKREYRRVVAAARKVRGVEAMVDQLEPHRDAGNVPSLQGEGPRGAQGIAVFQHMWRPATQTIIAVAGIAATGACLAAYQRRWAPAKTRAVFAGPA
jgi:hypothetical protein